MVHEQGNHSERIAALKQWLDAKEGENCEYKEAKAQYSFTELSKYCCAIANEGGGKILLGVTDKRPRRIVGSRAYEQPERTRQALCEKLHLRIDFEVFNAPEGRVLVFIIPSRPIGIAIQLDGVYWARETDSLVPMSDDKLRLIHAESGRDFSAEICEGVSITALSRTAIEDFRKRWIGKSGNNGLANLTDQQLLRDAELMENDSVTYAAIILFGTKEIVSKYLGQAEVIYEYRTTDSSGPAAKREEYRIGFFDCYEDLWTIVNQRNDFQHYQDGLFVKQIPTFDERSIREAILNAVSHRNYQLGGSVYIRHFPKRLIVESPGGLPVGITLKNILDKQSPRNRRLSEAFAKCGLVDRSGQGMNLIFEQAIKQGKAKPDFTGTDAHSVVITLQGQIQDESFIKFLERIGQETLEEFNTHDFLVMDVVHKEDKIDNELLPTVKKLITAGVVEKVGRKYILARRYYSIIGRKGVYTRKKGLDRETNKQLLYKHISDNNNSGSKMLEFSQILPAFSRHQIHTLLEELRDEGKITCRGCRKAAKWYVHKSSKDNSGA